ncbi:MAG: hypothetical protein COA86_01510 [Kangiella sp.]|nr:MAG: hypothetical protein COA86_01510 [Kangiella sp.]
MTNSHNQTLAKQALESIKSIPIQINSEDLDVKDQSKSKINLDRFNKMMDEAAVRQYLCENPDFFDKQPDLLSHLDLNHSGSEVPSLIERQVKTLREKNQSLQTQLVEMLQAAYRNEELLNNCNRFMLHLLQAEDLTSLVNRVLTGVKEEFDLDASALILVGEFKPCHPARVLSDPSEVKQLLNNQFPDNSPLCGRLENNTKLELFGELANDLKSSALIPLGENCRHGLLALASKDDSRFSPEMGTLFLDLIAKTITGLLKNHNNWPRLTQLINIKD